MKFSIITPSFNQAEYIERTIQSVLKQKEHCDLEYIVMDGGSADGTLDILKKYEKDIIWVSEKDRGQTHAINKGIKIATGDIIAYLNSDDVYSEHALKKVIECLKKNPEAKWISGKCRIIDEKDAQIRKWITSYKNFFLKRYSYNKLLAENFVCQPATFWRREVVDEFGMFDESQQLVMDYEYWLRIGKKYPLFMVDEYIADFRWYRNSKSGSMFGKQFYEDLQMAKKYAEGRKWPIFLHQLNYWKILGAYNIMRLLKI